MASKKDQFGVISKITKKKKPGGHYEALWHELNAVPHIFDLVKGDKQKGWLVWNIDQNSTTEDWEFDDRSRPQPFEVTSGDPANIDSWEIKKNGTRLRIHNSHTTTNDVVTFDIFLIHKSGKKASTDPSFINRGLYMTSRPSKIKAVQKAKAKKKVAKKKPKSKNSQKK